MFQTVQLACHPSSPFSPVNRIQVLLRRTTRVLIELSFTATGHIARLSIPAKAEPRRADKLWQHTCFEAFLRAAEGGGYYEFNFSPSTQWAAYRFEGYRQGMSPSAEMSLPRIHVESDANRLTLSAGIDIGTLQDVANAASVCLALSAVIEDLDGRFWYWAVAHPSDKPDFHHPGSFVLPLPAVASEAQSRCKE